MHGFVQRTDANQRYTVADGLGDQLAVTPHQHHGAAVGDNRIAQVLEVGALAVATSDQHKLAFDVCAQALDGGQRGPHIGGLGVVVPGHAIQVANPLAAMFQTGEATQRRQHGVERQADRMPEGQSRQRVGLVVGATDLQLAHRHQVLEFEGQVFLAVLFTQPEALEVRYAQAERPARHALAQQRTGQRILAVEHHLPGTPENPVLGQVISRQAAIAVHVVFADVQHSRHFGAEMIGGLKLEARQLHHVQLDVIAEQVQRRRSEVTADGNPLAGGRGHFAHQGGHGTFRIGPADGNDRRLGITREQLDITGQFHATGSSGLQGRRRQGQAGAYVELVGAAQELDVQLATSHVHLRIVTTQRGQLGRILPRIGHGKRHAPARQEANQGHAALAEADNDAEVVRSDQGHSFYLSFRVARPISTRITVMIQKRTITRGSGQPLSSKWWWIGAMRNTRRPVNLKDAT
ncbi:hypothetical protein ALQ77_05336 [Pseudomonas corrugata]|uniref:Uncharacterized protein n=1 Tax=Pseudomonas corrugata TaxID=47879 RepID=A0A3M3E113_9PSED|nr:hypothetical protein ALQ77_05336 [Pseudomonas corrugata]